MAGREKEREIVRCEGEGEREERKKGDLHS